LINKTNAMIGGLFGLECQETPKEVTPPFISGRDLFLVNGRSGIWLLVNRLRPPHVWMPSYLCHTMLSGIDRNITDLRLYEVDYELKVRSNEWISEVTSGDLVIFIDYFGFPHDHQLAKQVKAKDAWVLEDACQALLSDQWGSASDFVLFSLRKWIGVPDGGILRVPENFPLSNISLNASPPTWWLKALLVVIRRREFDDGLPTREWFKLFREVENTAPIGPYAMSELSRVIFEHFDYSEAADRRIRNYQTLLDELSDYAICPPIKQGVVPLGFPVRVKNRDGVREQLFQHEIYPPVHWLLDGVVPLRCVDSHRLSSQIMTLPCDQRYRHEDMERIADIFLQITTKQ